MSGKNSVEAGTLTSSPAAPLNQEASVCRLLPSSASPTLPAAPEGTARRTEGGDAEAKATEAATTAAAAVERTAAQAAAAQAAAASAKGAAAAVQATLAAAVAANEQDISGTEARTGETLGLSESAAYSVCGPVGEEAAATAARAAAAATSAASEAASAAAAVAEAANSDADYQTPSQLEDFLVSQGLRVAVALEAAATAAAAAADAAAQVAAAATRQAADKSSNAIAAAAQRCHEAAASATASAVAAFSAAASSTADSIASAAAAARAAIGEVTGAATQKVLEAAKAFEDTIAVKTAALENALLWRESAKSHDSEASRSHRSSSSSSSFAGYRLRSSSQFSSSSNRSRRRGRSSLLHYFSSDYEREGSQGGAPEFPLDSADTGESAATAEGKLTGEAAVSAFLSGCEEPILPHVTDLEEEEDSSRAEQNSNSADVAATDTAPRRDSVDAIVAAAAAEAAAYEALAKQQLHHQLEGGDSFSPYRPETSAAAASAEEAESAPDVRERAAANGAEASSTVVLLAATTNCPESPARDPAAAATTAAVEPTGSCEDTEEREPQRKILQTQARHTSAPSHDMTELEDHTHLQVQHQYTSHDLEDTEVKERHGHTICEDAAYSSEHIDSRRNKRGSDVNSSSSRSCSLAASSRTSGICCCSNRLEFRAACRTQSSASSSRKARSLLECRLHDFLEQCTAGDSEGSACSCSNCSSTRSISGQLPFNLQQLQAFMGTASIVSALGSTQNVVRGHANDPENDDGPVSVAGRASRAFLECIHFSVPTISLQQQRINSNHVYYSDEDAVRRRVLLFPFACISVTDLVKLLHCMEDPRVHTRVAGLEITATALEDPVSFTILDEVLQYLQESGLLPSLFLLRITGYSNADLRASLSPERQRRIRELQQSAAANFRPFRAEASASLAATEAAVPARASGLSVERSGHCSHNRKTGGQGGVSSSSSDNSTSSRSSSCSSCSRWISQPLYVPPLQVQRSLRAMCRLLPQLQRLELLDPKATADAPKRANAGAGEQTPSASGRPVFSKLSRLLSYISPFAVLVQALGFQLLSVRVTELVLHCNNCRGQRVGSGTGRRSSSLGKDQKNTSCSSSCGRMGCKSSSRSNFARGVTESCRQPSSSTRTPPVGKQEETASLHLSRSTASRNCRSNWCGESPVSNQEEGDIISAIIKRTVCVSCDAGVAPARAAATATTVGRQHQRQRFVLDTVIFSRTRQSVD